MIFNPFFSFSLALFSISLYTFGIVQLLNNTMEKCTENVQWGRAESQPPSLISNIFSNTYEIYEKNFINIDQCAMIHEQGYQIRKSVGIGK